MKNKNYYSGDWKMMTMRVFILNWKMPGVEVTLINRICPYSKNLGSVITNDDND